MGKRDREPDKLKKRRAENQADRHADARTHRQGQTNTNACVP